MKDFISSNALSGPPKPASASATIGASQYVPFLPSAESIWSARRSALFKRLTSAGRCSPDTGSGRDRCPGEVRVGSDLPAGEVDRIETRLDHLHGLRAGERTERGDVVLGVQQLPQPLRAETRQRVLDVEAPADPLDVGLRVRPLDSGPPRVHVARAHLAPPSLDCVQSWSDWILNGRSDAVNRSFRLDWIRRVL